MAKADDTTIKIDCWLRDALKLAHKACGTDTLAEEQLREWLTAGKLPWRCWKWEGLDAKGLAKLKRENPDAGSVDEYGNERPVIPSAAYYEGDPRFWAAQLKIDWEDNTASELATKGARARGIQVSRTHLLALLPEAPKKHETTSDPPPTKVQKAASGAGKKRLGHQARRALPVLERLKKQYPDGKIPDEVSIKTVTDLVNNELKDETRNLGKAEISPDTIERMLGRRKK